jgi:hypothetical protein
MKFAWNWERDVNTRQGIKEFIVLFCLLIDVNLSVGQDESREKGGAVIYRRTWKDTLTQHEVNDSFSNIKSG